MTQESGNVLKNVAVQRVAMSMGSGAVVDGNAAPPTSKVVAGMTVVLLTTKATRRVERSYENFDC